jgi:transcriptional regulator with XRE-family HTH domain
MDRDSKTKASGSKALGELVRKLRKSQGLTQAQLAKSIGVDESYISKIEKGKLSYTPSEETLRLMAQVLEADPLELLQMAEKTPDELQAVTSSPEAREFFDFVRNRDLQGEDWSALTHTLRRRLSRKGRS